MAEEAAQPQQDTGKKLLPLELKLNGKLVTSIDGTKTNPGDFQILKNFRYVSNGIKGIMGMSKINTTALTYPKMRSGIHFKKDSPAESHVLVQAYNSGETDSKVYKNDTAIPSQGDFNGTALHTDASGASAGRFSKAPDGCIAYCNSKETMVWGGDEYRCGAFINFHPANDFKYDYSEVINNTLSDSPNTAILKRVSASIDSNTMLLLHLNNNVTDSSPTTAHTVTNTNATFDASIKKFGSHAATFNGTTAYCTVPDNADFDLSGGTWTIDKWVYVSSLAANMGIIAQKSDADRYYRLYIDTNGAVILKIYTTSSTTWATGQIKSVGDAVIPITPNTYFYECTVAGTTHATTEPTWPTTAGQTVTDNTATWICRKVVDRTITTPNSVISATTWAHIEVVESGSSYYIFVNGTLQVSASTTDRIVNLTGTVYIGAFEDASSKFNGNMDEFRISNSARHTSAFTVPVDAYGTNPITYVYIGSTRPIKGAKFYSGTANATAGTTSAFYHDGSSWAAVTGLSDGTASAGKPLAQTGSITFDDTKLLAKTKIIYATQAYYYLFTFEGIDNNTSVYYVTLDASFQPVIDIWDGIARQILSFKMEKSTIEDYTIQTTTDDYNSTLDNTYVNIGGLTSSQYLYSGFDKPVTALNFYFGGGKENTNAATISIDYWNGDGWISVGSIDDGTLNGSNSAGKTGIVSWNALSAGTEFTSIIASEVNFYYYRIHFSATLSTNVYLYYVSGIPAQEQISGYKFTVSWQNRLWLCSDQSKGKNKMKGGSAGSVCVFNGSDSLTLSFEGDEELTGAMSLFTRFGGSVYDMLIVTKKNETWLVDGTSPSDYRNYLVAPNYGCPSPETMKLCDIGMEISPGLNKHVIIWQASTGIVMFDGNTISPIHGDIENYFDPTDSRYINESMIHKSTAFYDDRRREYHWAFASGSSTTLNEEWIYNLVDKKWSEVDRGTKDLQLGIPTTDTNGNKHIYGTIDTGYLERLENGTSLDGSAITYQFRFQDMAFHGLMYNTEIRKLKLVAKVKNTTSNSIAVNHYLNTSTTASTPAISVILPAGSNRVINALRSVNLPAGIFHSLDFQLSTTDETIGFEPLSVGLFVKIIREDIKGG